MIKLFSNLFFIGALILVMFSPAFAVESTGTSLNAAAQESVPSNVNEAKPESTYLICKLNKVVRTLRVAKKSGGSCTAFYTKDGVEQVVGNSWAVERCAKIIDNIKSNLEKAEWKCKDISESRVSSSENL